LVSPRQREPNLNWYWVSKGTAYGSQWEPRYERKEESGGGRSAVPRPTREFLDFLVGEVQFLGNFAKEVKRIKRGVILKHTLEVPPPKLRPFCPFVVSFALIACLPKPLRLSCRQFQA
jgi:hypothetical protein